MSDATNSKPVFIKAENVGHLKMTGNTVKGNADFAHLQGVGHVEAHDNKHLLPNASLPVKQWHERVPGFLVAVIGAVVAGLVVAYLAFRFGWTQ